MSKQKPETVDYFTQSEAARLLGWSKQRMWWSVKHGIIPIVKTKGDHALALIPALDLVRLLALQPSALSEPTKKDLARRSVQTAINRGKLERLACEVCGSPNGHAHHDDYSKPLAVRWLCRPCHGRHHAHERAKAAKADRLRANKEAKKA